MVDRRTATATQMLQRDTATWRALPLDPPQPVPPTPTTEPRAADRIKEALLRWLEEEM